MLKREEISQAPCWIIKVGSALLTNQHTGLNHNTIENITQQINFLAKLGHKIILVSSGSIAAGMHRLGWSQRPQNLHQLQAAAAVGQTGLMQAYESNFNSFQRHTAQILLSRDDLRNRSRYLNARQTLTSLLEIGIIPIVNENDTVATDEICFGDNDTLAAYVANLVNANLLVILTDQQGLYTANPDSDPTATLIHQIDCHAPQLAAMASSSTGQLGRGGMLTKVKAAQIAERSGTATVIASGAQTNIIEQIHQGHTIGTFFPVKNDPLTARKQWLASLDVSQGVLQLDAGACQAILNGQKSLLPIGVKSLVGQFNRGDIVRCTNPDGETIARGLANYSSADTKQIVGKKTHELCAVLGYQGEEEIIHRDNMILANSN